MPTPRDFADVDAVAFVQDGRDESHREPVVEFDPAGEIDTLPEKLAEKFGVPLPVAKAFAAWHSAEVKHAEQFTQARTLTRSVEFLMGESNAKLAAVAIAFAGGLDCANASTMASVADRLCLTRAAISKRVNRACDTLQLPRSRYMKSASAREAYRKRASEVHRRNRNPASPNSQSHEQPRHDDPQPDRSCPRQADPHRPDVRR
jgi:hypothetical protein